MPTVSAQFTSDFLPHFATSKRFSPPSSHVLPLLEFTELKPKQYFPELVSTETDNEKPEDDKVDGKGGGTLSLSSTGKLPPAISCSATRKLLEPRPLDFYERFIK